MKETMARCPLPEQLAAYAAGDVEVQGLGEHVAGCGRCREQVARIGRADGALRAMLGAALPPEQAGAMEAGVRERLAVMQPPAEILTLPEAAAFLRLTAGQLEELLPELPCFELAGQVRIRRARLLEWIAGRERRFAASAAMSQAARMRYPSVRPLTQGVAS